MNEFAHNFEYLEVDSRLKIAFEGKPKGFAALSYIVHQRNVIGNSGFRCRYANYRKMYYTWIRIRGSRNRRNTLSAKLRRWKLSAVNRAIDQATCSPGTSQESVESVNGKKGKYRFSTQPAYLGYKVPVVRKPEYDLPVLSNWGKPQ